MWWRTKNYGVVVTVVVLIVVVAIVAVVVKPTKIVVRIVNLFIHFLTCLELPPDC